jgi:16S rRNA pseudouridine516 synthase
MRLDKYLSACGLGTRTEVKKIIWQGVVSVGGETARDQGMQVKPGEQSVVCNGVEIVYREHVYIMMNKPEGVVTATEDRWSDTALDLLNGEYAERRLSPAGRLDRDATGLLLLTDDGALAHEILSPKKHVAKVYEVLLDAPVDDADIVAFEAGIDLTDFTSKPAKLVKLDGCRAEAILTEGKFHQV